MSAEEIINKAKEIRQRLRNPPNAVYDPGIDLTRKSTAHKGSEPNPDPPVKKTIEAPPPLEPSYPPLEVKFPITFDDIVEAVSIHYGLTTGAIRGSSRRTHTVFARYMVIHLSLKLLARRSLKSIGRDLGKDHSTIIAARDRFLAILSEKPQVAAEALMIENYIETTYRNRPSMAALSQPDLARFRETSLPLS